MPEDTDEAGEEAKREPWMPLNVYEPESKIDYGGIRIQSHFRMEANTWDYSEPNNCHSAHPVVDVYMLYDGLNMKFCMDECVCRLQNVLNGYEPLADDNTKQVYVKATLYSEEAAHEFPPIELAVFCHRKRRLVQSLFGKPSSKCTYDKMARYFLMDSPRLNVATPSVKILHFELHFYRPGVSSEERQMNTITNELAADVGRHIDCWRRVRLFECLDQFFRVPAVE